jgi:TrmH family RNA methyltransferase
MVIVSASARAQADSSAGRTPARIVTIPDRVFQQLSATETAQGVMALVEPPAWTLADVFRAPALVAVLDGVQDPGNAGTIVRAAEAFGATGVLFLKGSVSPHNPKSLRASAGSLFRLPCVAGLDAAAVQAAALERHAMLYAALPARRGEPAHSPAETDLASPCALIVGNEARGIGPELRAAARRVSIPTTGVESLNAAMAAAVLLYEAQRQRTERA